MIGMSIFHDKRSLSKHDIVILDCNNFEKYYNMFKFSVRSIDLIPEKLHLR